MSATFDGPRIGIVGAGNIAILNVAGYLEDPRCRVAAVCDPVDGRADATFQAGPSGHGSTGGSGNRGDR
jgi:predicted dehydrogenase